MRLSIVAILLFYSPAMPADDHKLVVGATEPVLAGSAGLAFIARIDTGAETSSVHAEDIQTTFAANPAGQPISFMLVNKMGQSVKVETRIDSVVKVKTSEGSEQRYKVPLKIRWNQSVKSVLVTLNDRAAMHYALLLGRNWLRGDFIVDVDK